MGFLELCSWNYFLSSYIGEYNQLRQQYAAFVGQVFRDGEVRDGGTAIADILPPMGLFGNAGVKRVEKKKNVLRIIKDFFDRFSDISGCNFFKPDID